MKQSRNNSMKQMVYTVLLISGMSYGAMAHADFDSGSDGSDGALKLDTPGEFLFEKNAFNPALDADGDGIFHFTTIEVAEGVTVKFPPGMGPVTWLATGDVVIDGVLDLNGEIGHHVDQPAIASLPGPGGFGGGVGNNSFSAAQPGEGPGGGGVGISSNSNGGAAGHGQAVFQLVGGGTSGKGGVMYGNQYLLPLIGGSGGGGSGQNSAIIENDPGSGGGAGGGAILIAGSTQIQVNGRIVSNGGHGGGGALNTHNRCAGGGSGGAIRLVAQKISGNGIIIATGGDSINNLGDICENRGGTVGSPGRIRLESFVYNFTGTFGSNGVTRSLPGVLFLPADATPIRILSVGGVAMPANASGSFDPADIVINAAGAVEVEIEAHGIPVGTVVKLSLFPEGAETVTADSSPLAGTEAVSTATANVLVPHGFSRFYITANWIP